MKTLSLQIARDFISLLYPQYCIACENGLVKGENLICTGCLLEMPKSNYHRDNENPFCARLRGRIPIRRVLALYKFSKGSRVQHLLHALKYRSYPEVGVALGRIYGDELREINLHEELDLILPVPLHKHKKRSRGYNQSEEFGKGLADLLNVECTDKLLQRVSKTETQTRKTKLQRWINVSDRFSIVAPEYVQGKRILLIDDVITTGATIEACADVLLKAGCKELSVGCIAAAQ